ncbi:MAG: UDP-N-acetylmuramoyl-L-alanine--D-glutamate ligase [Acetobacteraceae bacterium]|nr:UDP-N-acetylmuramoyl-L-alanine--D-glutamate ligase [Acetobacteraceae bacterium]
MGPGAGDRTAPLPGWLSGRAAVVGLGTSNLALVRYLSARGAKLTGFDRKPAEELGPVPRELAALGVDCHLGPDYLKHLKGFDVIFLTPGMKKSLPEVERARAEGAVISSETHLFFAMCRGRVVGVTGSAGKSTTTTLTGLMLEEAGVPAVVGGNIGRPLIEQVEAIGPETRVVMELSSFQLELMRQSPWLSAILNLSPNHLDVHASFEEYVEAKANIFRFQGPGDACVLNADSGPCLALAPRCPGRVVTFSRRKVLERGACLEGGRLTVRLDSAPETICRVEEVALRGLHNLENLLAASALAILAGGTPEACGRVARTFPGLEHRLEPVRELDGVIYINDSIGTSPDRTLAALEVFSQPLVLIAGGYDKKIPFDELGRALAQRVKALVLMGATAPKIEAAWMLRSISRSPLALTAGSRSVRGYRKLRQVAMLHTSMPTRALSRARLLIPSASVSRLSSSFL